MHLGFGYFLCLDPLVTIPRPVIKSDSGCYHIAITSISGFPRARIWRSQRFVFLICLDIWKSRLLCLDIWGKQADMFGCFVLGGWYFNIWGGRLICLDIWVKKAAMFEHLRTAGWYVWIFLRDFGGARWYFCIYLAFLTIWAWPILWDSVDASSQYSTPKTGHLWKARTKDGSQPIIQEGQMSPQDLTLCKSYWLK